MKQLQAYLKKYFWLLIITLSIPAIKLLLVPGFFGASDDMHIAWLYEMDQALKIGQIPPRFVPDLSFGFGYPLFNFVFPFPFYLAELFHFLGFNLVDSIKSVFLISIPLSGIFMYLLIKKLSTPLLALTGAVIYMYAPYRATDIYLRGAIGEIISFIFLPLIALSIVNINVKNKNQDISRWMAIGGISTAFLILSHNITAYMFVPQTLLLVVFLTHKKSFSLRKYLNTIYMFSFGLIISSYFWLPALIESRLMKYDTVFNFIDHFPTIRQLFTPYWGYGASVPGPGDGMSFFLGIVNIGMIIFGGLALVFYLKRYSFTQKRVLIWAFTLIFSSIFLMNHRSTVVWNNLPLIKYFQFPWRFLMATTFAFSLLVIALDKFRFKNIISVLIISVTLITSKDYFRPEHFLGRTDEYYLNRYIPTPIASTEYYSTQEEYLRLPKNTFIRPDKNYPIASTQPDQEIQIKQINSLNSKLKIQTDQEIKVDYYKYYFPGWQVSTNGNKVEIYSGEPFGQVSFNLPPGEYEVEIKYQEPAWKMILDLISLAGLLTALILILRPVKRLPGLQET